MNVYLQKLDELLAASRPEFYESLQAPLNDEEINQLEEKFQTKIPDDLRELYKWKNGQHNDSFEALVNNCMFVSLEYALEVAKDCNEMIGLDFEIENWWNDKWIPVFDNGGGDNICYDCGGAFTGMPGQLVEFWHEENDRNVIAPSLEAFISNLVKYYETTPQEDFDEFFEMENIKGYPKKFTVDKLITPQDDKPVTGLNKFLANLSKTFKK